MRQDTQQAVISHSALIAFGTFQKDKMLILWTHDFEGVYYKLVFKHGGKHVDEHEENFVNSETLDSYRSRKESSDGHFGTT